MTIDAGVIDNANISSTAEIAVSKLANGTANQVLTTDGTDVTWSDDLTIAGNLTVNGTQTVINSTTLQVDDKNIELATIDAPSDTSASGGGIILKGTTDHTIVWTNSSDSWDFSEHVNIASGKEFRIAGSKVLDATSLGSAVVSSSLTSVGTLGSLAVTNNITVGGTVDGRDVATDGTKLDGIESGATADQTKADIDALGINATTLGSVYPTSFLRGDEAATKTSGDLSFSDSVKAKFGAGDDLKIYHDGSHSRIVDSGTGSLISQASRFSVHSADDSETMIDAVENSHVKLYHNGNEKLATTADGVDIVGTGALKLPVGTTAQRPSSPATGDLRFSSTDTAAEIYNGTAWASVGGGGATGGGSDQWVVETDQTVTTSYELGSGKHGTTVSPTINSGATITVPSGAILVIL
jgi:hypothetical protein